MNAFNKAITSSFSLLKKKALPPQPNPTATCTSSNLNCEIEEDGFTIVGQSWSERNTLYPQNRPTVPPPSYQQVSSMPHDSSDLPHYHDVSRSYSVSLAASAQIQQPTDRLDNHSPSIDYQPPHVIYCSSSHHVLHGVPFILSPHIDPLTEDTLFVEWLPHLDISELTYDFSLEKQVLSSDLEDTHCCNKNEDAM